MEGGVVRGELEIAGDFIVVLFGQDVERGLGSNVAWAVDGERLLFLVLKGGMQESGIIAIKIKKRE